MQYFYLEFLDDAIPVDICHLAQLVSLRQCCERHGAKLLIADLLICLNFQKSLIGMQMSVRPDLVDAITGKAFHGFESSWDCRCMNVKSWTYQLLVGLA